MSTKLGAGGEAEVFTVDGRPDLAFKRYRQPTKARAEKLAVMIDNPPPRASDGGRLAIAWPLEATVDGLGRAEGFVMPRFDLRRSIPLFQVYNPQSRRQVAPGFTWRYLVRTARNLAAIVDALHRAGYVVGDLNESNLLVSDRALVALVDCDSLQVTDPVTGAVHRCPVAKVEFTAPELQGRDLSKVDRTPESDAFALGVLVFQLLLEGVHPCAGVWRGRGEPPEMGARIRRRRYAHRRFGPIKPPPHALPLSVLPTELRRLVRRTFSRLPSRRPTAGEWVAALERAEGRLRTCARSALHVHTGRRCPWCQRVDAGFVDSFPGPNGGVVARPRRQLPKLPKLPTLPSVRVEVPALLTLGGLGWWSPVIALLATFLATVPAPVEGLGRWKSSLRWLGEALAVTVAGGTVAALVAGPTWQAAVWAPAAAATPVLAAVTVRRSTAAARWAQRTKLKMTRQWLPWLAAAAVWLAALVLPPVPLP
jgi:DNA-binding helix-hairpin-helix protein with protein kinase domain